MLMRSARQAVLALRGSRSLLSRPVRLVHRAGMAVSIQVQPGPDSLFDEPLRMRLSGLSPLQPVTMKAWLRDEKGQLFHSLAFYRADGQGELDPALSPSLGGHYTGVQPMGLLWSLSPQTPFTRLIKRDVASSPFSVHIQVFDGHCSLEQLTGQPLATATNQRWFMKEGVSRIAVREGRVRGTLFIPPGNGPFPGIVDLYGSGGGLMEQRASLLANHGFVTLALGYFGFDDLPSNFNDLDLEYFEEAVDLLRQHPKVLGPGVGAIGISKGGDLVLSMATFVPHVKAAVSIGGCNANTLGNLHYKNITLPGLSTSVDKIKFVSSNLVDISEVMSNPMDGADKDSVIPIQKAEGHFLFVVGEDDKNWKTPLYAQQAIERLKENGKENYELITYPEVGHLLEPPYFPFCCASFHPLVGLPVVWGGEMKSHALAQLDLWPKMQTFLRKHLEYRSNL